MLMNGVEMVYVRRPDGNGHWIRESHFDPAMHELFHTPAPETQEPAAPEMKAKRKYTRQTGAPDGNR